MPLKDNDDITEVLREPKHSPALLTGKIQQLDSMLQTHIFCMS